MIFHRTVYRGGCGDCTSGTCGVCPMNTTLTDSTAMPSYLRLGSVYRPYKYKSLLEGPGLASPRSIRKPEGLPSLREFEIKKHRPILPKNIEHRARSYA